MLLEGLASDWFATSVNEFEDRRSSSSILETPTRTREYRKGSGNGHYRSKISIVDVSDLHQRIDVANLSFEQPGEPRRGWVHNVEVEDGSSEYDSEDSAPVDAMRLYLIREDKPSTQSQQSIHQNFNQYHRFPQIVTQISNPPILGKEFWVCFLIQQPMTNVGNGPELFKTLYTVVNRRTTESARERARWDPRFNRRLRSQQNWSRRVLKLRKETDRDDQEVRIFSAREARTNRPDLLRDLSESDPKPSINAALSPEGNRRVDQALQRAGSDWRVLQRVTVAMIVKGACPKQKTFHRLGHTKYYSTIEHPKVYSV